MPFNHVAYAASDIEATHDFYTRVMGFRLLKTNVTPTPTGGWSRHVFYDTGNGEMIAFWDLHDDAMSGFKVDHAQSLGLPVWVNHVAFDAPTREALDAHRCRWQKNGIEVLEIDHEWCVSIYATDPNGIMVEFCWLTRPFTAEEIAESVPLLRSKSPPFDDTGKISVHKPLSKAPDGDPRSVHVAVDVDADAGNASR
jgi:catechol 2,3-dioxygenase-like lactoylglutathione lyase family enzyme